MKPVADMITPVSDLSRLPSGRNSKTLCTGIKWYSEYHVAASLPGYFIHTEWSQRMDLDLDSICNLRSGHLNPVLFPDGYVHCWEVPLDLTQFMDLMIHIHTSEF